MTKTAIRTAEETQRTNTTMGALSFAATVARILSERLDKGADYIYDTEAHDGGRIVPESHQEAYAIRVRDALSELLRLSETPV